MYNLTLVKAIHADTIIKNDVVAIFAVTPIKLEDFPPVLSMGISYKINDEISETYVNIQKQDTMKVRLVIYGETIAEKNPELFTLIKDEIEISNYKDIQFLAFYFDNIAESEIVQMTIIYGLWEKQNMDKRIEQTFNITFSE